MSTTGPSDAARAAALSAYDKRGLMHALAAAYAVDEPRICAERDEAIRERDEMRKANITPEDADRPLGQSVEYWQDRTLDHATALDKARAKLPRIRAEARAEMLAEVVEWLQERLEGHDSNCITVNIGGFKRRFGDKEREETPDD